MTAAIVPVPADRPTFLGAPRITALADLAALRPHLVVLGVPFTPPYGMAGSRAASAPAPAAVRDASRGPARYLGHHDFDLGGELWAGREVRLVDAGDVAMTPGRYAENSRATTAVVRAILAAGAVPVILGGDHAVPIPTIRAYEGQPPMAVVQLDAHLDWRDEVDGEREGLSSPMRRASELAHVAGMAQIGIRGVGSARAAEVDAALAYGSLIVTAAEVRRDGIDAALARVPAADRYYLTIDMDGLDPAIAPGVLAPAFGGLDYDEAAGLLRGVPTKGRVVGVDLVEIAPELDGRGLTSLLGVRLLLNLLGAMARAGQFGG
jgi:agmatinase